MLTSSTKREIGRFYVVVVQWRQRNVQKGVMHVQSCCFANRNLLRFCRFRRRRSLSSNLSNVGDFSRSWILEEFIQFKKKERKIRRPMFTSPIKRRVRWFHIVVVPWTSRKSTKKRADHVQSCCFAHRNNCFFFLFWDCRCRHRRDGKAPYFYLIIEAARRPNRLQNNVIQCIISSTQLSERKV